MYQAGQKRRKRKRLLWLIIVLLLIWISWFGVLWIRQKLKPQISIKQAPAVTTKISYASKTKHYTEPDFGIDLPNTWLAMPRPASQYQSYTWQSSDTITNGQQIEIYENIIPLNFAVNRVLIVSGQVDHINQAGTASDNCNLFTKPTHGAPNLPGVPAKWLGIDFLCDQQNLQRDVIGTSSSDGVNTVILRNPGTGAYHKFFFTWTDYSSNPDYSIFYNALQSFRMN